jgi:lysyl-tRNA synthetase class 2
LSTLERLKARAELLNSVRQFFAAENVLEVETPLLSKSTTTDPYLNHIEVVDASAQKYLLSSPEFAMKRLLVKGSGSIFQICKAFRSEEEGRNHRSEFTMLEWYMLDWDIEQLMGQVEKFLNIFLGFDKVIKKSYADCFIDVFDFNPHNIDVSSLRKILSENIEVEHVNSFSIDECLHLLFSEKIESTFNKKCLTFVFDFPASQAALATIEKDQFDNLIAKRFEVYSGGLELANAYQEEASRLELEKRFINENKIREKLRKKPVMIDYQFLAAMEQGLPKCAGIALGLDRLLMLQLNKGDIAEVISL